MTKPKEEFVQIRVDRETKDKLTRIGRRQWNSLSAFVREEVFASLLERHQLGDFFMSRKQLTKLRWTLERIKCRLAEDEDISTETREAVQGLITDIEAVLNQFGRMPL